MVKVELQGRARPIFCNLLFERKDLDAGETHLRLKPAHDLPNSRPRPRPASATLRPVRRTANEARGGGHESDCQPGFPCRISLGGMMVDAVLTPAGKADAGIRELLDNPRITTIHARDATRGCFAAKIERH